MLSESIYFFKKNKCDMFKEEVHLFKSPEYTHRFKLQDKNWTKNTFAGKEKNNKEIIFIVFINTVHAP